MRRGSAAAGCILIGVVACAPAIAPLQPRTDVAPETTSIAGVTTPESITTMQRRAGSASIQGVRQTIDSLLNQPMFATATWGVLVLGPNGDTVYARNAEKLLIPASNMKVVTTTTALVQLGPDYRFADSAVALPLRDTVPSDFGPMYDTAFVRTHALRDILPKLLKPSQNRLAEELFETLALERTHTLTRDSSIAVVQRQLTTWNVPRDGYILHDGSGFDRENYLSAGTIAQVLSSVRQDSAFTVFYDALPIAGVDGTLVHRMRATGVEGNVHAKTGSLHAIRSLSGYVTTAGGEQLTFSFLCNAFTVEPEQVTGVMDRAVTMLAGLPKMGADVPGHE